MRGTKRESLPPDLYISTYRHQAAVAYVIDYALDQLSILRIFNAEQNYETAMRV